MSYDCVKNIARITRIEENGNNFLGTPFHIFILVHLVLLPFFLTLYSFTDGKLCREKFSSCKNGGTEKIKKNYTHSEWDTHTHSHSFIHIVHITYNIIVLGIDSNGRNMGAWANDCVSEHNSRFIALCTPFSPYVDGVYMYWLKICK